MNAQQRPNMPPFQPMQPMHQQQLPTALTRFVGLLRALTGTAMTAGVLLIAAELVLPGPVKPSQVMGGFYGKIVAAESIAAQDTLAAQTRKGAEAQALPPVVAQRIDHSLEVQTGIANLADLACIVGQFMPREDPENPDLSAVGDKLRTQACGLGDAMRTNMAETLRHGAVQQDQGAQQ